MAELFAKGLPISVQLGASALILALLVGGALGIVAALNQNTLGDYAVIALATAGSTIPTFVIAPVIQLVFGLTWSCCRSAAGATARCSTRSARCSRWRCRRSPSSRG